MTVLMLILGRLDKTEYNRKTEEKRTDVVQTVRASPLAMFPCLYTSAVLCKKKTLIRLLVSY